MRKSESKKEIKVKLKKVVKYLLIYIFFLFLPYVNLSTDFHKCVSYASYLLCLHGSYHSLGTNGDVIIVEGLDRFLAAAS